VPSETLSETLEVVLVVEVMALVVEVAEVVLETLEEPQALKLINNAIANSTIGALVIFLVMSTSGLFNIVTDFDEEKPLDVAGAQ